jgi:hypothetical protein
LEYAALGWRVFPVLAVSQTGGCECGNSECDRPGKHPAIKGWPSAATTDAAKITAWWSAQPDRNIGIATGKESNLTVLDVDGDEGVASLTELTKGHGGMPETPCVTTRPGRYHYYFRYSEEVKTTVKKLGAGLDTRNDGGYVVAPPSRHVSGGLYSWLQHPSKVAVADWPEFLNGNPSAPKPEAPTKETFNRANPDDVKRLTTALPYVDFDDEEKWGQVGVIMGRAFRQHDAGYAIYDAWAARSRKYDRKRSRQHYYERSKEPHLKPLTTASLYGWATEGGWLDEPPQPNVYTMKEMAGLPRQPTEWLVPFWLPLGEGVVLGGHGGSGKSIIMAMLAVCTAANKPFYGMPVKQGPVLIYSCEDKRGEWEFRLGAAALYLGVNVEQLPITFVDMRDFDNEPALFIREVTPRGYWLAEQVNDLHPVLVILDSATDCFAGEENTRREVRGYLRRTQRLIGTEACVIHILHIDKAASRGKATTDLYSGVTDWNNGVRARLALYRPEDDVPLRLEVQKINHGRPGAYVELEYRDDHHLFMKVGTASGSPLMTELAEEEAERAILRALIAAEDAGDAFVSGERSTRNAHFRLKADLMLPAGYKGANGKKDLFLLLQRFKTRGLLSEESKTNASKNKSDRWIVTDKGRAFANSE